MMSLEDAFQTKPAAHPSEGVDRVDGALRGRTINIVSELSSCHHHKIKAGWQEEFGLLVRKRELSHLSRMLSVICQGPVMHTR